MKTRTVAAVLLLVLVAAGPLFAPKRIYVGNLPFSGQLGIHFPSTEVELGAWTNAKIVDAGKIGLMKVIATDPGSVADMAAFSFAKGDQVKVRFSAPRACELTFPKQKAKARLHFEEKGGKMKAILDWLGGLEAPAEE